MIFILQILFRLNVDESTLKDVSYFECIRNTEIPNKIIKLLKSNNTFYNGFNYEAFDKITKKNKMIEIRNLVSNLSQISWDELDEIINSCKIEINTQHMNYNILEIRNINKWKKYWIVIYKSWNIFRNKFNKARTPFSAFKFFNNN